MTGGPPSQHVGLAAKNGADARLIERAGFRIEEVGAFEEALVEVEDGVVVVEGAAALVLPRTRYCGDASRGVHVGRAVAAAREAVAEAEIAAFPRPHDVGEFLNLRDRQAGDRRRPFRGAGRKMRLELTGYIGIALEVDAVGVSVAEEHVHDCAGERAVRAGPQA